MSKLTTIPRIGLLDLQGAILHGFLLLQGHNILGGDPGLGWHIKTGEWIASSGQIPQIDPFLFTTKGTPWVSDQWGADLLFWLVTTVGGVTLLHTIVGALVVATYIFLLSSLLQEISSARIRIFFIILLTALNGSLQWFTRPVVFSFFLFTVLYIVLYRFVRQKGYYNRAYRKRLLISLPPLFLLWANLHPGFILGWFCLGAFCLQMYLDSEQKSNALRFIVPLVTLSVAATCCNPYGVALHRSIFQLARNEYFMNLNSEWLGVDLFIPQLFWPFLLTISALFCYALRTGHRIVEMRQAAPTHLSPAELLLLFMLGLLAFLQRRYIPFFGVVAAVPLLKLSLGAASSTVRQSTLTVAMSNIARKDLLASRGRYTALVLVALVVVAIRADSSNLGIGATQRAGFADTFPNQQVALIEQEVNQTGRAARVFHTPDYGGFLSYRLFPRSEAYIDDRNQLVPESMYEEFFIANNARPGWKEILSKYHFDWALLQKGSPLRVVLTADPNWKLVNQDDRTLLFRSQNSSSPDSSSSSTSAISSSS